MAFPERDHAAQPRRAKISFENRIFLMVLGAGLLPSGIAFLSLRDRSIADSWYWTIAVISVGLCAGMAAAVRSSDGAFPAHAGEHAGRRSRGRLLHSRPFQGR